jgi:hypothetical protein
MLGRASRGVIVGLIVVLAGCGHATDRGATAAGGTDDTVVSPSSTTSAPTTTSTTSTLAELPSTTALPASPTTAAPPSTSTAPKPTVHPISCPSGALSWAYTTSLSDLGSAGFHVWQLRISGTVRNVANAPIQLGRVLVIVSESSSGFADIPPSPDVLAPGGVASFSGSTTGTSANPPSAAGVSAKGQWADLQALPSCPPPRQVGQVSG